MAYPAKIMAIMEPNAAAAVVLPTTCAQTVPITATAKLQWLDVAVMHEKALGILASLKEPAAIEKKHVKSFFENIVQTNLSNNQQLIQGQLHVLLGAHRGRLRINTNRMFIVCFARK